MGNINIQTVVTSFITIVLFLIGQFIIKFRYEMKLGKIEGAKEATTNIDIKTLKDKMKDTERTVSINSNRITKIEIGLDNIKDSLSEIKIGISKLIDKSDNGHNELSVLRAEHERCVEEGYHK